MQVIMPIPSYASNKYRNTVELLKKARALHEIIKGGRVTLGQASSRNFKKAYEALSLKEQVLGYLEDMTNGEVHRKALSPSDMRTVTDWLLADTPEQQFPIGTKSRAFSRVQWLRSSIHSSSDPERVKREILRTIYLESRQEIDLELLENLVLAGGGAKALSLAGAIKSLEERGCAKKLKRVAGTSGGAIIAMVFAAGGSARDLEKLVLDNEFGLFTLGSNLDNRAANFWAHSFSRGYPNAKLHVLSDNKMAHIYHKFLLQCMAEEIVSNDQIELPKISQQLAQWPIKDLGVRFEKLLQLADDKDGVFYGLVAAVPAKTLAIIDGKAKSLTLGKLGDDGTLANVSLYKTPKAAMVSAMRHRTGQDLIRGFFGDVLVEQLSKIPGEVLSHAFYGVDGKSVSKKKLRNIDFEQWQELHKLMPESIKELHISMSILKKISKRIVGGSYDPYEHQDASYENDTFKSLPVIDAVRVSMNLPPIYPRYKFDLNGRAYYGSDGGLKSNISLATFDSKYEPERTIGVFYKTAKELESTVDVNRMLVIPRSAYAIEEELQSLGKVEAKIQSEINELTFDMDGLKKAGSDAMAIKHAMAELMDASRQIGGNMAGLRRELDNIHNAGSGIIKRWISRPMDQFGHLLHSYLESKSRDNLGKSHNLRRLVMVNTHDIETWTFKMTHSDKIEQISHGKKAMDSLMNGTYCLENHFYFHQFRGIQTQFLIKGFEFFLDHPNDENLTPYTERPDATEHVEQKRDYRSFPRR
jgi:predicted acylesterase/phospholipase RssA